MAKKSSPLEAYLSKLPEDRAIAIKAICEVVEKNIDAKFELGMQYGMPSWYLPHSEYPDGYHCDPKQPLPFAGVASQKNHIGLHLFFVYCDQDEADKFVKEWKATGKRLDMGKSCVRIKKLEDIPLEVVARLFKRTTAARFVKAYEAVLSESAKKKIARNRAKRG